MIRNLTKDIVISKNYKVCKSLAAKAKGLMFSKKQDLIFEFDKEQRVSLHMLFVFFPIWAVYLDKDKKVVYVKKLLPFISMSNPSQKAKYIIELVEKPNIEIGDNLKWNSGSIS